MSSFDILNDLTEYIELSHREILGKIRHIRTYIWYNIKRWALLLRIKKSRR